MRRLWKIALEQSGVDVTLRGKGGECTVKAFISADNGIFLGPADIDLTEYDTVVSGGEMYHIKRSRVYTANGEDVYCWASIEKEG